MGTQRPARGREGYLLSLRVLSLKSGHMAFFELIFSKLGVLVCCRQDRGTLFWASPGTADLRPQPQIFPRPNAKVACHTRI